MKRFERFTFNRIRWKIVFEVRKRLFRRSTGIAPPEAVVVEFDYHCPLRCKTCRLWTQEYRDLKSRGDRTKLSMEEMKRILRELAACGVRSVIFLGGEPFLYKDVFPLIQYARSRGLVCSTFTNGYLMNEELVNKIVDSKIESICFSLDGPTAEIHDSIRGRPGVFDSAVAGIRAIQRMKQERKQWQPMLSVQTTVSAPNVDALPDMMDLATSLGVAEIRFQYISDVDAKLVDATDRILGAGAVGMHIYGELLPEMRLTEEQVDRIPEIVKEIERKKDDQTRIWIDPVFKNFDKKAIMAGVFPRRGCKSLTSSATISAYGDVTPCAMLNNFVMGDVRESSFKDIWSGPAYASLRKRVDGKLLPICLKCCDKL